MYDEFGSIQIGGDLPEELLEEFKAALVEDCYNLTEKDFHPILARVNTEGHLHVHENCREGEFSNTERFCEVHGLQFLRKSDATDEYEAVCRATFPKGTPVEIFPDQHVAETLINYPTWDYEINRDGEFLLLGESLMGLKDALMEINFENAAQYISHETEIKRNYAKAILAGKDKEFLVKFLIQEVPPLPRPLPPFRIVKGKTSE